jgi:hypothetical protein
MIISFREASAPLEPKESKPELMVLLINAGLLENGTIASFPSMKTISSMVY